MKRTTGVTLSFRRQRCPCDEIVWTGDDGEVRLLEVLILEGNPLLGTNFLAEMRLSIELTEGGEVVAEPL